MLIKEFFCLQEHGTVLLYRNYQNEGEESSDLNIRSSLISAIYTYVSDVEKGAIDVIQMNKGSLIFKKKDGLIFILSLEANISPSLCNKELNMIINKFFGKYPVAMFNEEVIELSQFALFKEELDDILIPLDRKLILYRLLIKRGLIAETDIGTMDLCTLGIVTGVNLINKKKLTLDKQPQAIVGLVNELFYYLEVKHLETKDDQYVLHCRQCGNLCQGKTDDCFYECFLNYCFTRLRFGSKKMVSKRLAPIK